ncbi:MAG: DUF4962 domain-containing protein [Azonexaceae bacterium]|nr:DUF4962 domain-containing protein [Azonexaceae bacterium]
MKLCKSWRWCLAILGLLSQLAVAADWWDSDPLGMPVRPTAGSSVLQNPPVFSWPAQAKSTGYEVQVWSEQSGWLSYRVKLNWLQLPGPLAQGLYRWRVRVETSSGASAIWSDERGFRVGPEAQNFVVGKPSVLLADAISRSHPRGVPRGNDLLSLKKSFAGSRRNDILLLKQRIQKSLSVAAPVEPLHRFDTLPVSAATNQAVGEIRNQLQDEQELVLSLGLLWLVEGDTRWRDAAMARVRNLANWDPDGSTGRISHTQASRTILLILSVGFDWFHDYWTASERDKILTSATIRYRALYDAIVANGSLAARPLNSFNSYTLGYLVATAPLLAKDVPDADNWFAESFPLYAAIFPAWSGDDGGYGNGTAYGVWDVPESIVLFDLLRWSTGFNYYQKPAIKNFGALMAYFLPPGAPEGVFGDGAEVRMASSIARYGKSFSARVPSGLLDWYSSQLFGEDRRYFSMLSSPDTVSQVPSFQSLGLADSIYFPSVGWAAMHSSLADRGRVSVYFKSSPLGSFNHSHADQNSFVIHARGRVLAMDSGYYDYYNSPHWRNWYKQTRAHNAITFDGGQGQSLGDTGTGTKAKVGRVTRFVQSATYDLVAGDAASAFDPPLSKAIRTVVFIRPSTVVVVDELASAIPRRWEWNLHTPSSLIGTGSSYSMNSDGVEMCLSVSAPAAISLSSNQGYSPMPEMDSGKVLPHFWNRFAYKSPSSNSVFISVFRMDCSTAQEVVTFSGNTANVKVAGHVVSVGPGSVIVK